MKTKKSADTGLYSKTNFPGEIQQKTPVKKKGGSMKKFTDVSDDAYDKKHGIKEGSKKDKALDKKRGVPEDDSKKAKKKPVKMVMTTIGTPISRKMLGMK